LNFADSEREIWVPFPQAGTYQEKINANPSDRIVVSFAGEYHRIIVPSNYGRIYLN
jgi:hypothetical protein